jgi:hypothetical protein
MSCFLGDVRCFSGDMFVSWFPAVGSVFCYSSDMFDSFHNVWQVVIWIPRGVIVGVLVDIFLHSSFDDFTDSRALWFLRQAPENLFHNTADIFWTYAVRSIISWFMNMELFEYLLDVFRNSWSPWSSLLGVFMSCFPGDVRCFSGDMFVSWFPAVRSVFCYSSDMFDSFHNVWQVVIGIPRGVIVGVLIDIFLHSSSDDFSDSRSLWFLRQAPENLFHNTTDVFWTYAVRSIISGFVNVEFFEYFLDMLRNSWPPWSSLLGMFVRCFPGDVCCFSSDMFVSWFSAVGSVSGFSGDDMLDLFHNVW